MLFTSTTNRLVRFAILVGFALALGGCMGAKPFAYHPIDEIPQGPGAFSGNSGAFAWRLWGDKQKSKTYAQAPQQPQRTAQQPVYQPAPRPVYQQPAPVRNGRMVEAVTRQ
jgi:hypothetical protein